MDKKYVELFTQIAKTTSILSNQVAEYDHKNNNEKGAQDAISMKNDFQALADKLSADDFDTNSLTLSDFRKILVGGLIVSNNISTRMAVMKKIMTEYSNVISKMQRIVDECHTQEDIIKLSNELFSINT